MENLSRNVSRWIFIKLLKVSRRENFQEIQSFSTSWNEYYSEEFFKWFYAKFLARVGSCHLIYTMEAWFISSFVWNLWCFTRTWFTDVHHQHRLLTRAKKSNQNLLLISTVTTFWRSDQNPLKWLHKIEFCSQLCVSSVQSDWFMGRMCKATQQTISFQIKLEIWQNRTSNGKVVFRNYINLLLK